MKWPLHIKHASLTIKSVLSSAAIDQHDLCCAVLSKSRDILYYNKYTVPSMTSKR